LTGAKADERQTLLGILAADPTLADDRPSNRSTKPSKANSTWNATAGTPQPASPCASGNASSL
jgi:hypothetical protein